jgi:hypothetical protein
MEIFLVSLQAQTPRPDRITDAFSLNYELQGKLE